MEAWNGTKKGRNKGKGDRTKEKGGERERGERKKGEGRRKGGRRGCFFSILLVPD